MFPALVNRWIQRTGRSRRSVMRDVELYNGSSPLAMKAAPDVLEGAVVEKFVPSMCIPLKSTAPGSLSRAPGSTTKAYKSGIALVPADRRRAGIVPSLTVRENIALPVTGSLGRNGFRLRRAERETSRKFAEGFDIRGAGLNTMAGNLSGGNQQKLAIARSLQGDPKFLLLEEPTQGIDIGAKSEIRHHIGQLVRNEGMGALVASSEFEDLIGFSDVLHVMRLGRIVATFDGETATYSDILHAALP